MIYNDGHRVSRMLIPSPNSLTKVWNNNNVQFYDFKEIRSRDSEQAVLAVLCVVNSQYGVTNNGCDDVITLRMYD